MSHPLLERLREADPEQRRRACEAAVEDPSAVLLVDALAGSLGDPAKQVSRAASRALIRLGQQHDAVRPALRGALRSGPASGRWMAAFTLARLAPPEPALLPALVEALASDEGDVRWLAARLLVDTGRLHSEVLTLLLQLANADERPAVRRMAGHCLRELAPDHPAVAQALLKSTRDDDPVLRRAAYTALASLLDPPRAVIQRLAEAVELEPDPKSRRTAALALERLAAHPTAAS
jgi:HEAT repeat protein